MNETYTLCPGCGQRVEPTDPGVVYAVEMQRVDTMGTTEYVEGMGGFFHDEHCLARVRGWRPKPMPPA